MNTVRNLYIEDNMCTIYKLIMFKIQNIILDSGFHLVNAPSDADVALLGVCAAFDADEQRSNDMVEKVEKANIPIFIYGCMTQVNPHKLNRHRLYASWQANDLVKELTGGKSTFSFNQAFPDSFRKKSDYRVFNPKRKFIGISSGCSFECSFCPHKKGAGDIKSVAHSEIMNTIAKAVDSGAETLILTGIDTACYGLDIGSSFQVLLQEILKTVDSHVSIHIAQFNPEGIFFAHSDPQKMLELWSDPRIKYVQLPIQTASPRLLALMNRKYNIEMLDDFLASLKKQNPRIMLRTDLLVGFPTETIEDLESSIAFTAKHYSEAALYVFEMKQGTPLSFMDLAKVTPTETQNRLQQAAEKLQAAGLLVHGGGQRIKSLLENDKKKERIRG